jgi:hypothetical protein
MIESTAAPADSLWRLHGHGGGHPEIRVARQAPGKPGRATEHKVLGGRAALSKVYRDLTMAATRKRLGYRPGTGKAWRAPRGAWVRSQERRPHCAKGHDWLTLPQAAQQVGGSATVGKRCSAHRTFPARQGGPQAPWRIQRTDVALPAVQAVVQGGRMGRRPPGVRPALTSPPAGAAPAATAPAEPRSPQLVSGVQ